MRSVSVRLGLDRRVFASWRRAVGLAIVATGAGILVWQGTEAVGGGDARMRGALVGGLFAALATALGTLPVLLSQQFSQRAYDSMLGFGAGVMLAASSFSLILPALNAAKAQGASGWEAGGLVGGGLLLGALILLAIDRWTPHEHFIKGREGGDARSFRRVWLFVLAIALHNLPEGLAIGVAFAANDPVAAASLSLAIAIQDLPEGFVIAVALMTVGYSRRKALLLGAASGLVEPVGAVLGAWVVSAWPLLLPWGLGFAAGAMLFVISHEIIPESHRKGHERWATQGLMLGFALMMVLDTALG